MKTRPDGFIRTASGRNRPFFAGSGGGTMLVVNDEAAPYLAWLARTFPNEFNKALRRLGGRLRKTIRAGMESEAPGGSAYPPLSEISRYRLLDDYRNRRNAKTGGFRGPRSLRERGKAYGKLIQAVGYRHEPELMRVQIGWLSASAASRARQLQAGFRTSLTSKMRRFFALAGIFLKADKPALDTPARPVIEAAWKAENAALTGQIESFISELLGHKPVLGGHS